MIYDTLNNLPNYLGVSDNLDTVIEYIMARDITTLPAGRTRIDGDKAVVTVSTQRKMEFEKLQEIIADVLNVDPNEVTMETTFADDLGADSMDVFQIVMGIEEEFDIQIEAEEAEHIVSVEDAVEAIKKKLAE